MLVISSAQWNFIGRMSLTLAITFLVTLNACRSPNQNSVLKDPPAADNDGSANFIENSLSEVFAAFASGVEPDLEDPLQRGLFIFYLKLRFGDPNTSLPEDGIEQIVNALRTVPNLKKLDFHPYQVRVQVFEYPIGSKLRNHITALKKKLAEQRQEIDGVVKQQTLWTKLIGETAAKELENDLVGKTDFQLKSQVVFEALLTAVKSGTGDPASLMSAKKKLMQYGFYSGLHSPWISTAFESSDARFILEKLRLGYSLRNDFIVANNLGQDFTSFTKAMIPSGPAGVPTAKEIDADYKTQLAEVESLAVKKDKGNKTVRKLSIGESPFRSCLGRDCSSRTYFSFALRPDVLFITYTNPDSSSDGQITLILGEAEQRDAHGKTTKIKVAMIDKIQNFDQVELPLVLEATRRSLADSGYALGIPRDVGEHNGLSNVEATRNFVKDELATFRNSKELVQTFTPLYTEDAFPFTNIYSRAFEKLDLVLLPQDSAIDEAIFSKLPPRTVNLTPEIINSGKTAFEQVKNLKNGSNDAKRKYLSIMSNLSTSQEGLLIDSEFLETIERWAQDMSLEAKFRYDLLTCLLKFPELFKENFDQLPSNMQKDYFYRWKSNQQRRADLLRLSGNLVVAELFLTYDNDLTPMDKLVVLAFMKHDFSNGNRKDIGKFLRLIATHFQNSDTNNHYQLAAFWFEIDHSIFRVNPDIEREFQKFEAFLKTTPSWYWYNLAVNSVRDTLPLEFARSYGEAIRNEKTGLGLRMFIAWGNSSYGQMEGFLDLEDEGFGSTRYKTEVFVRSVMIWADQPLVGDKLPRSIIDFVTGADANGTSGDDFERSESERLLMVEKVWDKMDVATRTKAVDYLVKTAMKVDASSSESARQRMNKIKELLQSKETSLDELSRKKIAQLSQHVNENPSDQPRSQSAVSRPVNVGDPCLEIRARMAQ